MRLATPAGAAVFALAGKDGHWRAIIPAAANLRLFGLSAVTPGRTIQSEGYLAVTPGGEAAQLRSGSGARVLIAQRSGVSLIAADFDRKGGTVISGLAPAGAQAGVTVDDKPGGVTRTDGQGRFQLALNEPLKPGTHLILAQAAGAQARAALIFSIPTRPAQGPFEAQSVDGSWRIDWLTPGGGMQSTVLFPRPGPAT